MQTAIYSIDYLFDADYATNDRYPTRSKWTIGMLEIVNEDEDSCNAEIENNEEARATGN